MADVGRNDPCPCGSGKKYKKCHLVEQEGGRDELRRALLLHDLDRQTIERLTQFVKAEPTQTRWLPDFFDEVGVPELDDLALQLLIPCAMYDLPVDGFTAAERLLRAPHVKLAARERSWLEAQGAAWLSVREIVSVVPGRSLVVRDVLTGKEHQVLERQGSSILKVHHLVLGRVVDFEGMSVFVGMHARPLGPRLGAELIKHVRRQLGVRTRAVSVEQLREKMPLAQLLSAWEDAVEEDDERRMQLPQLANTDGDPLLLTKDRYTFAAADRPKVVEVLGQLGEEDGDSRAAATQTFVVHKAGNAMHRSWDNTIVGRAEVKGAMLVLESNSVRRADDLRAKVETALPGIVKHSLREHEDPDVMMRQMRASAGGAGAHPRTATPPELLAALRELKMQHQRDWLDSPVPALGNLTPREAAKVPKRRKDLQLLLKEIEHSESQLPPGEAVDLRWMWGELGIE